MGDSETLSSYVFNRLNFVNQIGLTSEARRPNHGGLTWISWQQDSWLRLRACLIVREWKWIAWIAS